ncbi:MAG: hypothetical protein FWE20_01045, partial [Defluviitaleaceae bacterium]|nr:hypothetical protein [Defluviitaleaceae bacterium]
MSKPRTITRIKSLPNNKRLRAFLAFCRIASSAIPPTLALRMLNVCHRHTASLRTTTGSFSPTHEAKPGLRGGPGRHSFLGCVDNRFFGTFLVELHPTKPKSGFAGTVNCQVKSNSSAGVLKPSDFLGRLLSRDMICEIRSEGN